MDKIIIYSLLIFMIGCQSEEESILSRIAENLIQTKQLACSYSFQQVIPDMPDANWEAEGKVAFDFTQENALHSNIYIERKGENGFKRLFVSDTLTDIKSETSTLVKSASTDRNWLYGNLALYFLPFELREVLPSIANDSTAKIVQAKDTIIYGIEATQVKFELEKSIVAGQLMEAKSTKNRYSLTVRKKDLLPIAWEVFLENGGSIKTSFANLSTSVSDSTWEILDQQSQYLVLSGKEYNLRQQKTLDSQVGQKMTDWRLPSIEGDTLTNHFFEKKLTLYEFFFVGCIGSVKAKPYIDSLKREFQEDLQVLNIETQGFSKKGVQSFAERFHLSTPILYDGKELANQLGVKGCPTFILVDETGTIVHAGFGQVEKIKKLIEERLRI
ncbi:TlpA disulfide reductase family protein [Reichenbachiella sp. MALMAid0571]|uniref:TlpA family protein disulfide reductase n=1 Tax=Reichenbachiella sp. MALMAid0571 TaxID=3143939 RepID=UPI0032DE817F